MEDGRERLARTNAGPTRIRSEQPRDGRRPAPRSASLPEAGDGRCLLHPRGERVRQGRRVMPGPRRASPRPSAAGPCRQMSSQSTYGRISAETGPIGRRTGRNSCTKRRASGPNPEDHGPLLPIRSTWVDSCQKQALRRPTWDEYRQGTHNVGPGGPGRPKLVLAHRIPARIPASAGSASPISALASPQRAWWRQSSQPGRARQRPAQPRFPKPGMAAACSIHDASWRSSRSSRDSRSTRSRRTRSTTRRRRRTTPCPISRSARGPAASSLRGHRHAHRWPVATGAGC
jgi:hypothetical protein